MSLDTTLEKHGSCTLFVMLNVNNKVKYETKHGSAIFTLYMSSIISCVLTIGYIYMVSFLTLLTNIILLSCYKALIVLPSKL